MTASQGTKDLRFGGPATYRIVVQGALSQDWSDRLAGMSITTTSRGDKPPHTTLVGLIRDQAQLSGVLDALYGLHLPIVKVERGRRRRAGRGAARQLDAGMNYNAGSD